MRTDFVKLDLLSNHSPVSLSESRAREPASSVQKDVDTHPRSDVLKNRSLIQGVLLALGAEDVVRPLRHLLPTISLLVSVGMTHLAAYLTLQDASYLGVLKSIEYYIFCCALGTNGARFAISFLIYSIHSIWKEMKDAKSAD